MAGGCRVEEELEQGANGVVVAFQGRCDVGGISEGRQEPALLQLFIAVFWLIIPNLEQVSKQV